MIERIYILCIIIIIKSKAWTITHCLGLGHETMVCVVCLSMFLSIGFTVFAPAQDLNDYVEGKRVQNRWNGYVEGKNVSRTGEMIMLKGKCVHNRWQHVSRTLGQNCDVMTVHETLFYTLMQLKWANALTPWNTW